AFLTEGKGVALEPGCEAELEEAPREFLEAGDGVQARRPGDPNNPHSTTVDKRSDTPSTAEHEEDLVGLEVQAKPRVRSSPDPRGLDLPAARVGELVLLQRLRREAVQRLLVERHPAGEALEAR